MPNHPHSNDLRLFLNRFDDAETVQITVGRSGFGEMTVAEFRKGMPATDEQCPCESCANIRRRGADRPSGFREPR